MGTPNSDSTLIRDRVQPHYPPLDDLQRLLRRPEHSCDSSGLADHLHGQTLMICRFVLAYLRLKTEEDTGHATHNVDHLRLVGVPMHLENPSPMLSEHGEGLIDES